VKTKVSDSVSMRKQLMVLPLCPTSSDHGQMHLRDPKRLTNEQAWCEVWYNCPRCTSSTLFPSVELRKSLRMAVVSR